MCGIAGFVSLDGSAPDRDLVGRMTAALAHRGPDDEAIAVFDRAVFGHRRLAILDIEGGAQPMPSASGDSTIIQNGEVYNSPELRRELTEAGLTLRGHSDTEAMVEGLERHGETHIDRFNGIFALAWHHRPTGTTLLARDPFGVKPLYYHRDDRRLLFASEIRPILLDPRVRPSLDPDELRVLLTLRYNPAPGTLLKGVRKLLPGHYLRIVDDRVEEIPYDTWVPAGDDRRGFDDCVTEYDAALETAVRGQMLSDVPVGSFLSGGLDSSVVAQIMAGEPGVGSAFTVGFRDPEGRGYAVDERDAARATAEAFGLTHETEIVGPEDFAGALPEVIRSIEEPVGSASAVPYWFLARRAAQSVKVVLTGQGADEPHGGYPRYQGVLLATRFGRWVPRPVARLLAGNLEGRRDRLRRGLSILGPRAPLELLLDTYRHFDAARIDALIRPELRVDDGLAAERIERWRGRVDHLDPLAQMLYVDSRVWLADDLLLYGDKLGMAHGLEVRVPFLDRGLMRHVESYPTSHRVGIRRPKRLHKAALTRRLPAAVLERPKQGFDTPVDRWFRSQWLPQLPEWLWSDASFLPSILQPDAVRTVVEEHRAGRRDHSRRLYTLIALEFWGRSYL